MWKKGQNIVTAQTVSEHFAVSYISVTIFTRLRLTLYRELNIIPSLTVEKQKNGCKASKINACSRFLFRNDMCYCAIFFTLW